MEHMLLQCQRERKIFLTEAIFNVFLLVISAGKLYLVQQQHEKTFKKCFDRVADGQSKLLPFIAL